MSLPTGQNELADKVRNGEDKPIISQEHMNQYQELLTALSASTLAIEEKLKEVGRNINVA